MAAENMGIGIFSEYICRKKYRQYWISERNIKIQRCFLSVEYNLWIFGFWCAACCYNASGIRIVCRYDNDCFYTGIWICRRGDRNGTFAAAIFILHSGLALFYGTGMEDIIRNMEKQSTVYFRKILTGLQMISVVLVSRLRTRSLTGLESIQIQITESEAGWCILFCRHQETDMYIFQRKNCSRGLRNFWGWILPIWKNIWWIFL